jgi:hypothetical protein
MGKYKPDNRLLWLLHVVGLAVAIAMLVPTSLAQEEPTATPDAEGVIYSEVRPNDSLWQIAARAGITLEELLSLNDLNENDIIQPGQWLIVGYGTPAPTATVPATATVTRAPPTKTATALPPPRTAICLMAFQDTDKDGVRDTDESLKAAVAFTIFDEERVIENYVTDGVSEPHCVEALAPGNYRVTRSVGPDETLTSVSGRPTGDWAITLTRGNVLNLEFGSYTGTEAAPLATAESPPFSPVPVAASAVAPASPPPETTAERGSGLPAAIIAGAVGIVALLLAGVLFLWLRGRDFQITSQSRDR